MVLAIILTAVFLSIGSWNLLIAILGLFPKLREKSIGVLTKPSTHRNQKTRGGLNIPIITRYGYVYTVKGKEYCYRTEGRFSDRRLLPRAPIVYVKGFPRHGYPHKFKGTKEWMLGSSMLFLGVIWLFVIIYV